MVDGQSRENRVAVITGASSGIGKAAAKVLAAMGWHVIGVGRDPARSHAALAEMRQHAPDARVEMVIADLALMSQAFQAGREILTLTDRIDVLLNNAGGIGKEKLVTAEGNEAIFAGNHLGHFLLTNELLPTLRRTVSVAGVGNVRIVNVSSLATSYSSGLNWSDLQMLDHHDAGLAYCNVKIANQMFTKALAKRVAQDGIRVNAMHPGVARTNFSSHGNQAMQQAADASQKDVTVSAEVAADTLIWLATDPAAGAAGGGYFYSRRPFAMHGQALDDAQVELLWLESEAIIARSLA